MPDLQRHWQTVVSGAEETPLEQLSPRIRQKLTHREAAARRGDIAWRRRTGQVDEANNLIANLAGRGIGEDGYPASYAGPKTLD